MPRYRFWAIVTLLGISLYGVVPQSIGTGAPGILDSEIEVTPTTFEIVHDPAPQSSERILTIQNLGDGLLHWSASESTDGCESTGELSWISTRRNSGTIDPQSQDDVLYTIDSAGLSGGVYSGALCLSSNDPDEALIKITVQLTVGSTAPLNFHRHMPLTRRR